MSWSVHLVVDVGVVESVLFDALFLVETFGGKHVAAEFGVQIAGMVCGARQKSIYDV